MIIAAITQTVQRLSNRGGTYNEAVLPFRSHGKRSGCSSLQMLEAVLGMDRFGDLKKETVLTGF